MHIETAMTKSERIEINPEVMLGKPVIRGTRVTVELLLRKLSEGATEHDLLDAYPHLTHDDIKATIAYAADMVARERQPAQKTESLNRASKLCGFSPTRAAMPRLFVRYAKPVTT